MQQPPLPSALAILARGPPTRHEDASAGGVPPRPEPPRRRGPCSQPCSTSLGTLVHYPCRSGAPGPNHDPNRAPQHPYRHLRRLCSRAPPRATGSAAARTPLSPRPHDLHRTVRVNRAEVKPEKITVSSGSFAENPLLFAKMNPRSTPVEK